MSILQAISGSLRALFGPGDYRHFDGEEVFVNKSSDVTMNAAQEAARAALPAFLARFQAQDREEYMLKARFETPAGGGEHVWMTLVSVADDGSLAGVLRNEPLGLGDLTVGSSVIVSPEQVTDWSYYKDDIVFGNFTTRALYPAMTVAEKAHLARVLSPSPLEDEAS